jgi:hypothetical protein
MVARLGPLPAAALLGIVSASVQAQGLNEFIAGEPPAVSGTIAVEGLGQLPVRDAQWSGTKGDARRVGGLVLTINAPDELLRLEYMCTADGLGALGWFTQDSFCGVREKFGRVEAVQIRLAGSAKSYFSVKYECHVQGIGDVAAKADGELCGTKGQSRRLEAVRVWIERRR